MNIQIFSSLVTKSSMNSQDIPWGLSDALFVAIVAVVFQVGVIFVATGLAKYWPPASQYLVLDRNGDFLTKLILYCFYFSPGLVASWWAIKSYNIGWAQLGWRRANLPESVLYLVLGFVVYSVGSELVLNLARLILGINPHQVQTDFFIHIAPSHKILAFFTLVVLPPMVEETVFRGVVFPAMAKRWGVVWGAIISSAVFGIAHLQANIGIYTFALGLVLCFMYARLKSIVPGVVLHMLNNYLAYMSLK